MENNEFIFKITNNEFLYLKVHIRNHKCYYFNDIIKFEDCNFENILTDEKSYENVLIYGVLYKALVGAKPLHIRFNEIDGFIRILDENMIPKLAVEQSNSS